MGPNEAIITCFRKYFDFKGRAIRSEFWWFQLALMLVTFLFQQEIFYKSAFIEIFAILITLFTLIPGISVAVRRLHDVNKSGYWIIPFYLIPFLPGRLLINVPSFVNLALAGLLLCYLLLLIYWLASEGSDTENEFGISPLNKDLRQ